MSIVPSLLQAVIHVDGDALVMHAGDKPYVVAPTGQTDLASRGLALDAVNGIVNQLLPADLQRALDEFGAVQYELPPRPEFPGEHFTVVAARGGDDVWVEVRRRRMADDHVPEEMFAQPPDAPLEEPRMEPEPIEEVAPPPPPPVPVPVAAISPDDDDAVPLEMIGEQTPVEMASVGTFADEDQIHPEDLLLPEASQLWPAESEPTLEPTSEEEVPVDLDLNTLETYELTESAEAVYEPPPPPPPPVNRAGPPALSERERVEGPPPVHVAPPPPPPPPPVAPPPPVNAAPSPPRVEETPPPRVEVTPPPRVEVTAPSPPALSEHQRVEGPPRVVAPPPAPVRSERPRPEAPQSAVVLPISRNPIRADAPPPLVEPTDFGLDRLLRVSAARGASTLYLSSDAQPSVRVDGELQTLDGEAELTARDVESLLLTLMPERSHEALRTGATTEWIVDIEDVGRVRCMSFRDHRGPGGVFRLMPMRSVSADQLGLPRSIQALAIEPEGLVLVAGPRSSGKRTLLAAYVDLINRSRRDHVIMIEREINIVHERGSSFISQREVRGDDDDVLAAARAALREDPDVLVIEDLRTGALMNVALEASASGRLVIGGFSAHTSAATIDRIIDLYAPEYRRQVQLALADNLRGVIVQVLLHKTGGGRVAAREVLLNTPAVASLLAEGKTSQLPMAIEGGRRHGMMPLNDSLVAVVQNGLVDSREAYRYSNDRPGLLALLKRQGLDTSFVERLA